MPIVYLCMHLFIHVQLWGLKGVHFSLYIIFGYFIPYFMYFKLFITYSIQFPSLFLLCFLIYCGYFISYFIYSDPFIPLSLWSTTPQFCGVLVCWARLTGCFHGNQHMVNSVCVATWVQVKYRGLFIYQSYRALSTNLETCLIIIIIIYQYSLIFSWRKYGDDSLSLGNNNIII